MERDYGKHMTQGEMSEENGERKFVEWMKNEYGKY